MGEPEHEGPPLLPNVVPRQQEVGERDPLPRLLQLLVEVVQGSRVLDAARVREGEVAQDDQEHAGQVYKDGRGSERGRLSPSHPSILSFLTGFSASLAARNRGQA